MKKTSADPLGSIVSSRDQAPAPGSAEAFGQGRARINGKEWNIICDFDGTITPFDVTDAVLERFALPEWEAVETSWIDGAISARECMERQVAMIRASRKELDAFLDTVPLDDGFPAFINLCRKQGHSVLIVSDGMDYAIRRVLSGHGLSGVPVIANRLVFHEPRPSGQWCRLEFPYGDADCGSGVCKCRVAGTDGFVLIGDGRSDCCVARGAALVLAKKGKELLSVCESKGYSHIAYENFTDVCGILDSLRPEALMCGHGAMAV